MSPIGQKTDLATAHGALAATGAAALACGLIFILPVLNRIDAITNMATSLVAASIGDLGLISRAQAQPAALTKSQSDALSAYNKAVDDFKSILRQRRAQIDSKQQLPNLPGQALYLARNNMISAYKNLTNALPSKIGRPGLRFGRRVGRRRAHGGGACA
jgi:hypothetical protein